MIKLLRTRHITQTSRKEAVLTKEQADLFLKDEKAFMEKYGEELNWEKDNYKHDTSEWYTIYTESTPY